MSDIPPHYDKFRRVCGRSGQSTHVPNCVAGRVNKIKASVSVEVKGSVLAKLETVAFLKIDLPEIAIFVSAFMHAAIRHGGIAGDKTVCESGADY